MRLRSRSALLGLAAVLLAAIAAPSFAEEPAGSVPGAPKVCADAAAEASRGTVTLPATAKALRERHRIKVLAIGATPLNERDQALGQYSMVEKALERSFTGLDVDIVDRGISGELARDAAERIRNEVALVQPDLVFWQVGVADALALTPPREFKATISETIRWLKAHDVDVILIGLRYQRALTSNTSYQLIRQAVREVLRDEGILRIGHYEAVEALDRLKRQQGEPPSELDLTEAASLCLADYLGRAMAAGLFAKQRIVPPRPGPFGGPPITPTEQ